MYIVNSANTAAKFLLFMSCLLFLIVKHSHVLYINKSRQNAIVRLAKMAKYTMYSV